MRSTVVGDYRFHHHGDLSGIVRISLDPQSGEYIEVPGRDLKELVLNHLGIDEETLEHLYAFSKKMLERDDV